MVYQIPDKKPKIQGGSKLRVSIVQMDVKFKDLDGNFKKAEELIRKASEASPDVICLPEAWSSGFFPKEDLKDYSDNNGERTKSFLGSLAKELNVNIVGGSVANIKGDKIYNTSFTFNRNGECIGEYDKIHLFSYMNEHHYFAPGENLVTFELDGVKCGIIICYDIRFLELIRTLALKEIDILFVPAQWPVPRLNHWETLNLARAIENQIYVVSNNSCGTAGETVYAGHSAVIDPWGEVLAKGSYNEEIITQDIDLEVVEKIRNTINVYRDRRPNLYKID